MKTPRSFVRTALLLAFSILLFSSGCTTAPVAPTSTQQFAAQGVDDTLSIGLVPILVKNPGYIPAANALADGFGAISGDQFTAADTDGIIAAAQRKGYQFAPSDEKMIRATINAAWDRFAKNYQVTAVGNIRPDVKLFANAAADGLRNAARQAEAAQ